MNDDRFEFEKLSRPSVWLNLVGRGSKWRAGVGYLPPTSASALKTGKTGVLGADGEPEISPQGRKLTDEEKARIAKTDQEMIDKEKAERAAKKGSSGGRDGDFVGFDTVKFDDPDANKKAAEIVEASQKAIDKKYGKLSYRNPDDREALNKRREEMDDLNNRYSSWLKDYARATSKVWNPGKPTEAEEKRMRQQMDLFKSQQMYESQLLRGEYKPEGKKKNRTK